MDLSSAPATKTQASSVGHLTLRGHHEPTTGMYEALDKNGWCVVPGVISPEKADKYVGEAYGWLEGFGKGFNAKDKSTWKPEMLPAFDKGGLYNRHSSGHEQFVWDIRAEPGLIDVFTKIWGTDQLTTSFDGVNISLPFAEGTVDRQAWPHVDQSPLKRYKYCIQGIMNLAENGPKDGGLAILDGSFSLYNQFFESHEDEAPPGGWGQRNGYGYTEDQLQWFYDRGCKWHKVTAGPGDVILWDSRCIHYGAAAEVDADTPRVATYVCYKPMDDVPEDLKKLKLECLERYDNTGHDCADFKPTGTRARGKLTDDERTAPSKPPVLSHRAKQLVGLEAY